MVCCVIVKCVMVCCTGSFVLYRGRGTRADLQTDGWGKCDDEGEVEKDNERKQETGADSHFTIGASVDASAGLAAVGAALAGAASGAL